MVMKKKRKRRKVDSTDVMSFRIRGTKPGFGKVVS